MAAFVLVHGTGHGGWCWRFIVPLLQSARHDVYTPTLTGLGASSHLLHELNRISLDTHVEDITNMLFYEDLSEVVLVGHSYGGIVITSRSQGATEIGSTGLPRCLPASRRGK